MGRLTAKLRYYPGDLPEGTTAEDIRRLGQRLGIDTSVEEIKNPKRAEVSGEMREETDGVPLEEISQTVITVETSTEEDLRRYLEELFRLFRPPRPPYAFWGSSPEGERITRSVADSSGW